MIPLRSKGSAGEDTLAESSQVWGVDAELQSRCSSAAAPDRAVMGSSSGACVLLDSNNGWKSPG